MTDLITSARSWAGELDSMDAFEWADHGTRIVTLGYLYRLCDELETARLRLVVCAEQNKEKERKNDRPDHRSAGAVRPL